MCVQRRVSVSNVFSALNSFSGLVQYIQCRLRLCSVRVQCMFNSCPVHVRSVQSMFNMCSVHIQCVISVYLVPVQCMFRVCLECALCIFSKLGWLFLCCNAADSLCSAEFSSHPRQHPWLWGKHCSSAGAAGHEQSGNCSVFGKLTRCTGRICITMWMTIMRMQCIMQKYAWGKSQCDLFVLLLYMGSSTEEACFSQT